MPPLCLHVRISLTESEEHSMKQLRRGTALLLSAAMVLGLVAGGFLIRAAADTAQEWLNADYDDLSRFYEIGASYNPGIISTVPGDPGGKSYGMYMFASRAGVPHDFAEWCKKSDLRVYQDIGETLDSAYHYISDGYGTYFDDAWRTLAKGYGDTFGSAQYDYTKAKFYDKVVDLVESKVSGFSIDDYSVALKNVFWSRAVHHGPSDACSLIQRAFDALGGFANQPEGDLIQAIYEVSGRLVTAEELRKEGKTADAMSGDDANKYNTTGRILRYFYGCSGGVQMSVYRRLRVNEVADALVMLMNNGYDDALLADGHYQLALSSGDQKHAVDCTGGRVSLNVRAADAAGQTFTLTYYDGGFYTLSTEVEGKTLRLSADSKGVSLSALSTSNSQKWLLERGKSGFTLKNMKTETYLCRSGDTLVMAAASEETPATEWQPISLTGSAADWTMRGLIYPTEDNVLVAGNSMFPVRGVISCSSPITSVNITVARKGGSAVISKSASPNEPAYDLKKLDDSIPYSQLSAGSYTFTLTAAAGGQSVELVSSAFTVSGNSGPVHNDETYTVTFDPNGGILKGSKTKTVSLDDVIYGKLPTAEKEGYTFIGWFTEKEGGDQILSGTKIIASDLTLYAHYADVYTYTFLDADGDIFQRGTVAEGEPIPAPKSTPTKAPDGAYTYTFSGWEGYTEGKTVMKGENMEFKPTYTATPVSDQPESTAYWKGLAPGSTVDQLGKRAKVYDGKKEVTSGELATGMTAVVGKKTYTLVVTGDVNGDGKITITDVVALQSHVLGKQTLEGAYKEAADLNGDGKITVTDVVKAARVIIGKDTIG